MIEGEPNSSMEDIDDIESDDSVNLAELRKKL